MSRMIIYRKKEYIMEHEDETKKFASHVLASLGATRVLALSGELGAGKTTFVNGLASLLGITSVVTSPTFVLLKTYQISSKKYPTFKTLVHIDAYRLAAGKELYALGVEEYFQDSNTLTVVEWAERVKEILPKNAEWITFQHV